MSRNHCTFIASILFLCSLVGCATAPDTAQGRAALEDGAATALSKAKSADPTFDKFLGHSVACAVFPTVGKGGFGIGGAYGKGVLYEADLVVGYCDVSQASIGFQLGGQAYTELLVFSDKDALANFKAGHFTFAAQATAVALQSGAAANAKFTNGVAAFSTDQAGLMYEASVGGQKFSYLPKDSPTLQSPAIQSQPATMPAPATLP